MLGAEPGPFPVRAVILLSTEPSPQPLVHYPPNIFIYDNYCCAGGVDVDAVALTWGPVLSSVVCAVGIRLRLAELARASLPGLSIVTLCAFHLTPLSFFGVNGLKPLSHLQAFPRPSRPSPW